MCSKPHSQRIVIFDLPSDSPEDPLCKTVFELARKLLRYQKIFSLEYRGYICQKQLRANILTLWLIGVEVTVKSTNLRELKRQSWAIRCS